MEQVWGQTQVKCGQIAIAMPITQLMATLASVVQVIPKANSSLVTYAIEWNSQKSLNPADGMSTAH